jgi:hypothetical protein
LTASDILPLPTTNADIYFKYENGTKYVYKNVTWNPVVEPNEVLVPCFTTNIFNISVELYRLVNHVRHYKSITLQNYHSTTKNYIQTLVPVDKLQILRFEPFVGFFLQPTGIMAEMEQFVCMFKYFREDTTQTIDPDNVQLKQEDTNQLHK